MSRTVWKFPFARFPNDETRLEIEVPAGSKPRYFAFQAERPTVWVEVDDRPLADGPKETWTLVLVGTGHSLPPGPWQYVGSALVGGGAFVFHVYARLEQG